MCMFKWLVKDQVLRCILLEPTDNRPTYSMDVLSTSTIMLRKRPSFQASGIASDSSKAGKSDPVFDTDRRWTALKECKLD